MVAAQRCDGKGTLPAPARPLSSWPDPDASGGALPIGDARRSVAAGPAFAARTVAARPGLFAPGRTRPEAERTTPSAESGFPRSRLAGRAGTPAGVQLAACARRPLGGSEPVARPVGSPAAGPPASTLGGRPGHRAPGLVGILQAGPTEPSGSRRGACYDALSCAYRLRRASQATIVLPATAVTGSLAATGGAVTESTAVRGVVADGHAADRRCRSGGRAHGGSGLATASAFGPALEQVQAPAAVPAPAAVQVQVQAAGPATVACGRPRRSRPKAGCTVPINPAFRTEPAQSVVAGRLCPRSARSIRSGHPARVRLRPAGNDQPCRSGGLSQSLNFV